jgi:hypothetical protein
VKPLPIDDAFFQRLREMDRELFLRLKQSGCSHCKGGPLDTSNYQRKIRGMGEEAELRFSLCCRKEGCRRRLTPPSLRFLGRRVHAAFRIILGLEFRELLVIQPRIARQTLARWRNFWREELIESSSFMRWARAEARLPAGVHDSPSLLSILQALGLPEFPGLLPALRLFTRFPAS